MIKNIQMPESFVIECYKLINDLKRYQIDDNTKKLCNNLETQIHSKMDALSKRNAYTKSKIAETSEERENARQEYLDLAGIQKDFRWNQNSETNK